MMDYKGLLLCARYSSAPNFFGYCGPDENETLVGNLSVQKRQREIAAILSEFETLSIYLRLISTENKLTDPFDRRVVEAYWVGNRLLNNVTNIDYEALLQEKLSIEQKLGAKRYAPIKRKIFSYRVYPHHSFHVFNIFKRTGNDPSFHTLQTMNECRIGWGRIRMENGEKRRGNLIVETKQLEIVDGTLRLGKPVLKKLQTHYKGQSFLRKLNIGDWVSFHWGFVCDVLNTRQVKNLEYYTRASIDFYNRPT